MKDYKVMKDYKEIKSVPVTKQELKAIYSCLDIFLLEYLHKEEVDNFEWLRNLIHVADAIKSLIHVSDISKDSKEAYEDELQLELSVENFSAVADFIYHIIPIYQEYVDECIDTDDSLELSAELTEEFKDLMRCFLKFADVSEYQF